MATGKRNGGKRSQLVAKLFWELREALPELEQNCFFDLSKKTKKLIVQIESVASGMQKIEAWTFVPHPSVIDAFTGDEQKLRRYIIAVDALRSKVYFPVKEFLEKQQANVTSYFTGGWADFLCDVQLDSDRFAGFLRELKVVLDQAGIRSFCNNVDEALSVFEVTEPIVICGRPVKHIPLPSPDSLDEVLRDRNKFETVYRNYRSPQALQLFGDDDTKLKRYLRDLKRSGIIICYKLVFDFPFGITRDYVPMILSTDRDRPIDKILEDARQDASLLKPVREWLKVKPLYVYEKAEQDINYFWLNEYEYPGQRKDWKLAIYRHTEIDVNLYNYPLESTLNESPVYLSDLPELLAKAKEYHRASKDKGLFIGWPLHPLLEQPPELGLPLSGLSRHGVTLGEPGCGKTNTDLVLASEASEVLKCVILLDASRGIESKIDTLPEEVANKLTKLDVTLQNVDQIIDDTITAEGLFLLVANRGELPEVFMRLVKQIERMPDSTSNNEARLLKNFLLVEEAGDALGLEVEERRRNVPQLSQLLTKAWRKGWCIWLSTQYPSSLGYDTKTATDLLTLLSTRVISTLKDTAAVDIVLEAFRRENCSAKQIEYLRESLGGLDPGTALCRGIEVSTKGEVHYLPLLKTRIRFLQKPGS